jgi:hypothetical protein
MYSCIRILVLTRTPVMAEATKATAAARRKEEENTWEEAAAVADNGRGIELRGVNVNSETDMEEVYEALNITEIGPNSRLRNYIQRLQTQQQQQQQSGKLRCCSRIHFLYSNVECCCEYGKELLLSYSGHRYVLRSIPGC